jgi:hypothetical protein
MNVRHCTVATHAAPGTGTGWEPDTKQRGNNTIHFFFVVLGQQSGYTETLDLLNKKPVSAPVFEIFQRLVNRLRSDIHQIHPALLLEFIADYRRSLGTPRIISFA